MSNVAIIIPCHLDSIRFPRKLLYPIKGKPLILWTAERIASQTALPFYFAVAGEALVEVLRSHGYNTVATAADLPSGTDRIAAANAQIGADIVFNIQADEPLVTALHLQTLLKKIQEDNVAMATLAAPFKSLEDFRHPNNVKVVLDAKGHALYFSRAPIPYNRTTSSDPELMLAQCYHHMGLYAYQAAFLKKFCQLPQGRLEQMEKLEQLRALENGYRIAIGLVSEPTLGVDTQEDTVTLERLLTAEAEAIADASPGCL